MARKGYHTFANLIWRDWSFLAYFNSREKLIPSGQYGSMFNDRGNKTIDGRGFVESAYRRSLGRGQRAALAHLLRSIPLGRPLRHACSTPRRWSTAGRAAAGIGWGPNLPTVSGCSWRGFVTAGQRGELGSADSMHYAYEAGPESRRQIEHRPLNRSLAIFAQQEWQLSRRWKAYLGGRLDDSRYQHAGADASGGVGLSAFQNQRRETAVWQSFRDPSAFEQFYRGWSHSRFRIRHSSANAMQTFEAVSKSRLGKKVELSTNVYQYRLDRSDHGGAHSVTVCSNSKRGLHARRPVRTGEQGRDWSDD